MTKHKRNGKQHNGSQKGKPYSDGENTSQVMSKEELEEAITPTRQTMSDG